MTLTESLFHIELFQLSRDPYDQERFRRRVSISVFDRAIWFLTPEDVVVTKLRWCRLKDRQDIANVLAVQGDRLDRNDISRWAEIHKTQATLDEIQTFLDSA